MLIRTCPLSLLGQRTLKPDVRDGCMFLYSYFGSINSGYLCIHSGGRRLQIMGHCSSDGGRNELYTIRAIDVVHTILRSQKKLNVFLMKSNTNTFLCLNFTDYIAT